MDLTGWPMWFERASKRRRYLVGVSGGADSVALLHLLVRSGFRSLVVCHLDHRLRGRASTGDARFVERLASELGCDFEGAREDVAKRKGSIETAGREARHEFFARCSRKWRCRRLLLSHHADDQAETVLWNLLRGSRGAVGMKGDQTISMDGISMEVERPLLDCRKEQLRVWLEEEGLRWREDATNAEPDTVRNRLRLEGLPLLEEVAKRDVVASLVRAAAGTRELREVEEWAVEAAAVIDPQGRVHAPKLRSLPTSLSMACLFRFLREAGVPDVDRQLVERALELAEPKGAAVLNLPGGGRLRRKGGRLFVEGEDCR